MRLLLIELVLLIALSAQAAENGGIILGSVRVNGKVPTAPTFEVGHDADVCGDAARTVPSLALGTNQAVRNVVIYLGASVPNGRVLSTNEPPAVLDQRDCEFVPRIQIAHCGSALLLRNSDPLLHVVQLDSLHGTNGPSALLQLAMPYAGFEKKYSLAGFVEPTLLRATNVNGHEWMTAYIAVLPHPWATLTDERGRFAVRGVPKGMYKLYAWHEMLGTLVRDVRITSEQKTIIDFEFSTGRK